jgi:hypothetical protein
MTNGKMFVSVRRGCHGYGRLCVLHKTITVDPQDESFRIDTKNGQPIALTVTQIFTCSKSLTKEKLTRKPLTEAWKNDCMRFEEKNMCSILQNFTNSVIACMKNEGYKGLMLDYWKSPLKREFRPNYMTTDADVQWNAESVKWLMMRMFATAYELILERGVCKVACKERTNRLSYILTNYRPWFVKSKCMADDVYVTEYEKRLKQEAPNLESFDGMMAQYTNPGSKGFQDDGIDDPPDFHDPDPADIMAKALVPSGSGSSTFSVAAARVEQATKAKLERQKVAVYQNVLPYVTLIVENWLQRNADSNSVQAEIGVKSDAELSENIELNRKKMAAIVYDELLKNPSENIAGVIRKVYESWSLNTDKPTVDYFSEEMRLIS